MIINFLVLNSYQSKNDITEANAPMKNDNNIKFSNCENKENVEYTEKDKLIIKGSNIVDIAVPKIISNCKFLNSNFNIKYINSNNIPMKVKIIILLIPFIPKFILW